MTAINDIQIPFKLDASDTAVRNAIANRLPAADAPFHSWYRFVLSFPSHLVRHYLDQFSIGARDTVLDPFCGTGTTLVECSKMGIASIGIEAHPMSYFAARVKTSWEVNADAVTRTALDIMRDVQREFHRNGLERVRSSADGLDLRALPAEQAALLIRDSIDPLPLHRALVLRDRIFQEPDSAVRDVLSLALAAALPTRIGNLHFGPEVGVRGHKVDVDVVAVWMERVARFAADLSAVCGQPHGPATAMQGDSRVVLDGLSHVKASALITSPPYPNEKDYTRTTRLESVVLGFISTKAELRQVKKTLVRSNTRNVYKEDDDSDHVPYGLEGLEEVAAEIERRRVELGKTSGFERMYPRVVRHYFGGISRHLEAVKKALVPGAHLAYVVGDQASYLQVMIRTGQLLAGIAERLGYEVVRIDLFRTRKATATRADLREEVVVLRWPG